MISIYRRILGNFSVLAFVSLLISSWMFVSCVVNEAESVSFEKALDEELNSLLRDVSENGTLADFTFPAENNFADIPQDPSNPITTEKVVLGKLLFHETAIGNVPLYEKGLHTYSCASCHHAEAGFQAGVKQGIGEGGIGFGFAGEGRKNSLAYHIDSLDVQPIRSPTAMNVAYQEAMLWNGQFAGTDINRGTEAAWKEGTPIATNHLGYEGVETQAIAGLVVHRMDISEEIVTDLGYKFYFDKAFSDWAAGKRYTRETAGLAIAAYERTILANKAPFQRWLKGEQNALTIEEKQGALLFFGKANCVSCHAGPALNSMDFYALGMEDLEGENVFHGSGVNLEGTAKGRGGFTGNPEDDYAFKVPQLYNLKDSPFYGHGGSFNSIREVLEYKNSALAENADVPTSSLSPQFVPLQLSPEEIGQLERFLGDALYDPELSRYKPSLLPSGYCFPNNDLVSKQDLGCD